MNRKRKIYLTIYLSTIIFFVVYFLFLSENNIRKHRELKEKKEFLENSINLTKNQINNKYTSEELTKDSVLLEQYIREQLQMQRKDEDVFIFTYE